MAAAGAAAPAGGAAAAGGDDATAAAAAPHATLADWLALAPFTLAMSSSFFGFYAHAGALQALAEAGLRPARVCGSSSGSIIAALYSGGLEPATTLAELLLRLRRADILTPFWSGAPGAGLYRINTGFLAAQAPAARLEDGRCPVAVSTYDVRARRTVTWRSGDTATCVAASCAIPGFMQPVRVEGRLHVDGGVNDLLGLASCAHDERVLSIDLHTQGLMRMRAVHVALLGARPGDGGGGAGAGWRSRLWPRGAVAAAEPALAAGPPPAEELAVPPKLLRECVRLQLHGLPFVGPRSMHERGAVAMAAGRDAMRAALATRAHWGGERVVKVAVPKPEAAAAEPAPAPALA